MAHLSENAIAELVAGTCNPEDRDRAITHLQQCAKCRDDVTFAVRVQAGQSPYSGSVPELDELVRLGKRGIADSRGKRHKVWALSLAAATTAAILMVVFLGRGGIYPVPGQAERSIHAAMVDLSNEGYIVIPSTEESFNPHPSTMRSPNGTPHNLEVKSLTRDERDDAERVFWETGRLMAAGGYQAAFRVAEEALKLSPGDRGLLHMRAIATYRDGRAQEAILQLEQFVAKYPDDAAALINLAVMLQESGRKAEAAEMIDRAIDIAGDSALGGRARWLRTNFTE